MAGPGRALYLVFLSAALVSCISTNFHVVEEGLYYRSAQLDQEELEEVIAEHDIRTIVNLRGAHRGKEWYDTERAVAEQYGISLVDIGMSARRLPHRRDLIKLLDTFREAERPLLVHCKAGADRTGEASAIYAMEYMGLSREQALEQLTCTYWHLAVFTPAKRYFIDIYEGRDWAYNAYDPCVQEYEYYDRELYCNQAE